MTDILATMGPGLYSKDHIEKAVEVGVTNFRINLGKRERNNLEYIQNLYHLKKTMNYDVKLFLDLPSSRPRISAFNSKEIAQNEIVLITDTNSSRIDNESFLKTIPMFFLKEYIGSISIDDVLKFDDGKASFLVKNIDYEKSIITSKCIKCDTILDPSSSITLPNELSFDILTSYELCFLKKLSELCLIPDFIAVSFVENNDTILNLIKEIEVIPGFDKVKIISKIESKKALENIDNIIEVSDGVMVARGDLGQNILPSKLPKVQEYLVEKAKESNKVCIIATQVLERFAITGEIHFAELSDISLAVQQCVEFVMLSGESAGTLRSYDCLELLKVVISEEMACLRGCNK